MKQMTARFYKMGRNETFAVFAITFAVVVAYSIWGSYLIHAQNASSPQVVGVSR